MQGFCLILALFDTLIISQISLNSLHCKDFSIIQQTLYSVPLDYLINENSEQPARVEEDNGEKRKKRKWFSWLICMLLIVVAVAIIIGAITVCKRPDKVNFNEVESEDWNDVSTEDIPIEWYDKYWRVQREWSDLAKIEPEEDVM